VCVISYIKNGLLFYEHVVYFFIDIRTKVAGWAAVTAGVATVAAGVTGIMWALE